MSSALQSGSTRPFCVALLGHSTNSDNLGVGALTVTEVDILREIAKNLQLDLKITVIEWQDTRPPQVSGPDIEVLRIGRKEILNPSQLFSIFRKSDLVIDIGAGDSFADIYGGKRISIMFAMQYQAHLAGCPFVMAPQTIGPFKSKLGRIAARNHLNRCRVVSTRDDLSTQFAREIGFQKPILEASDVALRLPFAPAEQKTDGLVRVGLNVSGLLMNGGYSGKNMFGLKSDYPALVRQLIEDFLAHENVELHLVPHVISETQPIEDDYRASQALQAEYPAVKLSEKFMTPSEAKHYISGMDFFMGARMHATIGAFSSGVPVVPMAYSRKFKGLFGTIGYDHVVECTTQDAEDIRQKIMDAFETRSALKLEVENALARGRDRLKRYTDALSDLMNELAKAKA